MDRSASVTRRPRWMVLMRVAPTDVGIDGVQVGKVWASTSSRRCSEILRRETNPAPADMAGVAATSVNFRLSVPFRGWVADHPRVHPVVRLGFPAVYGWESSEEQRVQSKRVWGRVIGVDHQVVVEGVEFDEDLEVIVVSCRLRRGAGRRCGRCGRRCGRYDQGEGRRRWRALDAGTVKVFIEAEAPRVSCPTDGVTVAAVPWARHAAGHTKTFDDQVAWLVTHCSKSAVVELMRVAWRSVGAIAGRVVADARAGRDPFDGLVRIGIDEISYRRGHRYLMVVVDHDSGRLVWAAAGHDRATLQRFFDLLGPERAGRIRLVSADAAEWIGDCATAACPNATLCLDPFHMCRWGSQALDVVRRWVWNLLRRMDLPGQAKQLKNCRYALWKNPEDLTARQAAKLAWIARHNHRLYRA